MNDDFDPVARWVAASLNEVPVDEDPGALAAALAVYRASRSGRRRGGQVARRGGRVVTVSLVTAVSGFLAAGYAAALPEPVQRAAHHLFAPVGLPAPGHRHHPARTAASARPAKPQPVVAAAPPDQLRGTAPSPPRPPRLQLRLRRTVVPAGAAVAATVTVISAEQRPLTWVRVQVASRPVGPWHSLLRAAVSRAGPTALRLPAFEQNTWIRLVGARAVSPPIRLHVVPVFRPSWRKSANGGWELRVSVRGLAAGERVLLTDASGRTVTRRSARVPVDRVVVFTFSASPGPDDRLELRVSASGQHAAAVAAVGAPASQKPTTSH